MKLQSPIEGKSIEELYQINRDGAGGYYPIGANNSWHGGIHLDGNHCIKAISDGTIVAYKVSKNYISDTFISTEYKYSNNFILLKHQYETPNGSKLEFFSLYYHLVPLEEYTVAQKQNIPTFLTRKQYLVGSSANDAAPKGLNLRSSETRNTIVIVAPKGSIIEIDTVLTEAEQSEEHWAHGSTLYKKVKFRAPDGTLHTNCFCAIGGTYTRQLEGRIHLVTKAEDPLLSSQVNRFKGIRVRVSGSGSTVLYVIPKTLIIEAEVTEGNNWGNISFPVDLTETDYLYNYKRYKNEISETHTTYVPELDAQPLPYAETYDEVVYPNIDIKAGDTLGHSGLVESPGFITPAGYKTTHFEVFSYSETATPPASLSTVNNVENTLTNPNNDGENKPTMLQIEATAELKAKENRYAIAGITATDTVNAETTLTILDNSDSVYVKAKTTNIVRIVEHTWLGTYASPSYAVKEAHLTNFQTALDGIAVTTTDRVEFVAYSTSTGAAGTSADAYRKVRFVIPESAKRTYWFRREDLPDSSGATVSTAEDIVTLYTQNPNVQKFETTVGTVAQELFLEIEPLTTFVHETKTWYEITAGRFTGWISEENSKLKKLSPFDWPEFKVISESTADAMNTTIIDFNNLTPFFQTLYNELNTDGRAGITPAEIKAALGDESKAWKLIRVVSKHLSEWWDDGQLTQYLPLFAMFMSEKAKEFIRGNITNHCWMNATVLQTLRLPTDGVLYHFHPLAFIEQINKQNTGRITLEMITVAGGEGTDEYLREILNYLNEYAEVFEVNTNIRIAHFLAQIGHESHFQATSENLSYSVNRMREIFGCRRNSNGTSNWDDENNTCPVEHRTRSKLWSTPNTYSRNPSNLGNYVYANRMRNGNEASGEGYKFRGRGAIQLTGKANYEECTSIHNERCPDDPIDFATNPDLIINDNRYTVESAFLWWELNNINTNYCTGTTDAIINALSKKVNGGYNGLADRRRKFNSIYTLLEGES